MDKLEISTKIIEGAKFYKVLGNNKIIITRVIKKINDDTVALSIPVNGSSKIKIADLEKDFTKLTPDALVVAAIVKNGDAKDVIISLYRKNDIINQSIPYVVCRQMVNDLYSNMLNNDERISYIGMSMSLDTVPEGVDYNMMMVCEKVYYCRVINLYMDDSLNDILRLLPIRKYNDALATAAYSIQSSRYPIYGYNDNLRDLLESNEFMYDFYKSMGIDKVTFSLDDAYKDIANLYKNFDELKEITQCMIINAVLLKYDKTIDLSAIQTEYRLLSDCNNKLWVLCFECGNTISKTYSDDIRNMHQSILNIKRKLSYR